MAQREELDRSLLAEIRSRLERLSETQHQLARDHRILTDAATRLRLGKSAEAVLAEIREQSPELLRDYCDIQITMGQLTLGQPALGPLTPGTAPLRSIGRLAASA